MRTACPHRCPHGKRRRSGTGSSLEVCPAEVAAPSSRKLRSAERTTLAGMTELRINVPDDVAARRPSEAAVRTSAEDLAADLVRRHVPPVKGSLSFVGMVDASEHGISVSEAERQLEDGDDNGPLG